MLNREKEKLQRKDHVCLVQVIRLCKANSAILHFRLSVCNIKDINHTKTKPFLEFTKFLSHYVWPNVQQKMFSQDQIPLIHHSVIMCCKVSLHILRNAVSNPLQSIIQTLKAEAVFSNRKDFLAQFLHHAQASAFKGNLSFEVAKGKARKSTHFCQAVQGYF